MAKYNIGSAKRSVTYRKNAEINIKKIMKEDPYVSLNALEKLTGYSRQTIAGAYLRIRKSSEWQTWRNNHVKISINRE